MVTSRVLFNQTEENKTFKIGHNQLKVKMLQFYVHTRRKILRFIGHKMVKGEQNDENDPQNQTDSHVDQEKC